VVKLFVYSSSSHILGRVSSKSAVRQWMSPNGMANVFSFTVMDGESEILVTGYRKEADLFFPLIVVDTVCKLSGFSVKAANTKYSTLVCPWELTLTKSSKIEEVQGESSVPALTFNFISVAMILDLEESSVFGKLICEFIERERKFIFEILVMQTLLAFVLEWALLRLSTM
jgi:hypothetical protein